MSELIKMGSCPNCNSSDAFAHYTDHKFCYSCKHYEAGEQSIADRREYLTFKNTHTKGPILPEDFSYHIPQQGVDWLQKYNITQKEVLNHRMGWSEHGVTVRDKQVGPLLIFPVYAEVGHLSMWQARNFGTTGPKYITRGGKDHLHILGQQHESDTIVLTEDLLSAIKVSRIAPSMPLWGSFMSLEHARRLSTRFKKAVIWLDKDKAQEALKQAANASHIFEQGISCIRTERDPKEYSTQEIMGYLKNV